MENIYLLKIMYILNECENHYENVYSNLEKAKKARYRMVTKTKI